MELFLLPENEIVNDFFINHSFSIVEILIFLSKSEKPYKIDGMNKDDVMEFIDTLLSVFFEDGSYEKHLKSL